MAVLVKIVDSKKSWEGQLAGSLLQWNPPSKAGTNEKVGEQKR